MRAACDVLSGGIEGAEEDQATADLAERILLAAMPFIRAAERERISGVIDPGRLDLLAEWFDLYGLTTDSTVHLQPGGGKGPEIQVDLRLWARVLRSRPDSLDPVEMVVEARQP